MVYFHFLSKKMKKKSPRFYITFTAINLLFYNEIKADNFIDEKPQSIH